MPKIEVDADQLAAVVAQAVASALKTLAKPVEPIRSSKPAKSIKKKRGRPRNKPLGIDSPKLSMEENIVLDDEIKEALDWQPPKETRQDRINPVKKKILPPGIINPRPEGVISTAANKRAVNEFDHSQMKCIDLKIVPRDKPEDLMMDDGQGNLIPYNREMKDIRPPAQKIKMTCDKCSRTFEDYPSRYPQALYRERDPSGAGEDRPMVRCEKCVGRWA